MVYGAGAAMQCGRAGGRRWRMDSRGMSSISSAYMTACVFDSMQCLDDSLRLSHHSLCATRLFACLVALPIVSHVSLDQFDPGCTARVGVDTHMRRIDE